MHYNFDQIIDRHNTFSFNLSPLAGEIKHALSEAEWVRGKLISTV